MRLVVAALTMVLALGSTALAQTVDLRAPDQQVTPTQQPVAPTDLRAPDQQAPAAAPTPPVVSDIDGGPATLVFVLIGLGVSLVLVAGGYVAVRHRHRPAIADDLVTG